MENKKGKIVKLKSYEPGKIVQTIDNPDDPNDQLVLVEYESDGHQAWFHSSQIKPRNVERS